MTRKTIDPELRRVFENAEVEVWLAPWYDGPKLSPCAWERLRLKLQSVYRRATGEPHAILEVYNDIVDA